MHANLMPLADVIRTHGLAAKKSLGQHFLLDVDLLARIVRSAGDLSGCNVIEIGPGPGGLTRALLASPAQRVVAIEKDRRCLAALSPLAVAYGERLLLYEQDAMLLTLADTSAMPRRIVANLPYNIGTALVVQWLEEVASHGASVLQSFTVMLQKEVAERMVALPGDPAYGRLSVLVHQYADAALVFDVPPQAFMPPPKVMSSVLHAAIRPTPREDVALEALEKITAAAFNQRRKMLRQSLKSLGVDAIELCVRAQVEPTLRAEQCDLAMFAALARSYLALATEGAYKARQL